MNLSETCFCISFEIIFSSAILALTSIHDIFGFRGENSATDVDHNVLMQIRLMNNEEMARATDLDEGMCSSSKLGTKADEI